MQNTSIRFDPDLADLPKCEWLTQLAGVAEGFGFFKPLGRKHFATHIRHGDTLVVTFETVQGMRALSVGAEPLDWSMVRDHDWSHLCIASDGDTWFRDRNVFGLFDRMIDDGFFEDFETILFYGASPCGYRAGNAPWPRANVRTMTSITLARPDDWHLHLRDGAMMRAVLPHTARDFARAIIMPNLVPPVITGAQAAAYRDRILAALPEGMAFEPLMTLYLTEDTDADDMAAAHAHGLVKAVKLYPAGATTNSASGVANFDKVRGVLDRMAEIGLPLCVHGEVTDADIDIFDREAVFIDRMLDPIRRATPGLHVVMEHITTSNAVDYARAQGDDLGATITTHHLVINRNHILAGGIKPHYYCLPVAKREEHRLALRSAAISGEAHFFLGTDSAPHTDANKLLPCGCAGCFTAPNTLPILAQVFEEDGALDTLEAFTSRNGPAFYGLPVNDDTVTLTKSPPRLPAQIDTEDGPVTVFDPGFDLTWSVC